MADWTRGEVTPPTKIVYTLPNPTNWTEVHKVLSACEADLGGYRSDDQVWVTGDEEGIYFTFDKPQWATPVEARLVQITIAPEDEPYLHKPLAHAIQAAEERGLQWRNITANPAIIMDADPNRLNFSVDNDIVVGVDRY